MILFTAPLFRSAACIGVILIPALHAQDTQNNPAASTATSPPSSGATSNFPAPEPVRWFPAGPTGLKFVSIGFRIPTIIHTDIESRSVASTVTANNPTTTTTTTFTTTPKSLRTSAGIVLEFPVYHRLTLVGEGIYHVLRYQETENIDQVVSAGTNTTNITQATKARQLDFPVMLRYTGLRHGGVLSKLFVAGGVEFRRISGVKTQTDTTYIAVGASAVNSTSYAPVNPNLRKTEGPSVAVGFKFMDNFNIRLTPEVRYTKFRGRIFNANSTLSREEQIDAGFALTF